MPQTEERPTDGESNGPTARMTDQRADRDTAGSTESSGKLDSHLRELLSSRREFLADSAKVGGGAIALSSAGSGVATAQDDGEDDSEVDQPEGFSAEVIVPHATFTDDVAAAFGVSYDDHEDESAFVSDPSTVLIARVTWEPGGTTGWHTHPGAVIVSVLEGEIEFVFREDEECVASSYAAGEALLDTGGHAEFAQNTSDTDRAVAYALFFSVPDGESPTTWVEPRDC